MTSTSVKVTKKKHIGLRIIKYLFVTIILVIVLFLGLLLSLRTVNPPFTSFTVREDWSALEKSSYNLREYWVNYDNIPDHMKWAVIAAEDQLFWTHKGFDVKSIQEAWDDHQAGRRTRGASTISQQVSKNLFLSGSQSFTRKGIEAGITILIEFFWSKERILEVYLNIAEFGPGIFGVGKAADTYWNIDPSKITPDQAARLASVLPSPKRMRVEPPSPYAYQRSRWILRQMRQLTGVSFGTTQPLPDSTKSAPDSATLFSDSDLFDITDDFDDLIDLPDTTGDLPRIDPIELDNSNADLQIDPIEADHSNADTQIGLIEMGDSNADTLFDM